MLNYKLSKKEKKLALVTVSLALAAIVFNFLLEPLAKNYFRLNQQIHSKRLALRQNQKLFSAYSRLENEYSAYSRYLDPVKSQLAVNQVLQDVETAAGQNSCRIINIKPSDLRDLGSYQEVVVDIALEATVKDFSGFIYQIESLTNPLRVKNFSLSPRSDTPGEVKANLRAKKIVFTVK